MNETAAPPTTLAIAEYNATAAGLAELRHRLAGVVYDLTTTTGQEQARKDRRECVSLRTALEARRVELKAPALERSRLIDAEAKALAAEILALEQPIDAAIKADEQRRAAEKEARERAERDRVAGIRAKIDAIKARATTAYKLTSAEVAALIEATPPIDASAFDEFWQEARDVRIATIEYLEELRDTKAAQEAEAARIAAEREELARLRAAEEERQAAARAEEQRIAAEARARREAEEAEARRQREEDDRKAAAERAEQDHIAREAREREEREARDRRQREDEERARVDGIKARIAAFGRASSAEYATAADIQRAIVALSECVFEAADFDEYAHDAKTAFVAALATLRERFILRQQDEQRERERQEELARSEQQRKDEEARAEVARSEQARIEAERAAHEATADFQRVTSDPVRALARIDSTCADEKIPDAEVRRIVSRIASAALTAFNERPAGPERKPRRRAQPADAGAVA